LAVRFVHRFAARYALHWCSVHTDGRSPGLAHSNRRLETLDDVDLDGRRLRKMRQHAQPTPEIDRSLARLDRVYSR